jgi:hypothetical protein
MPDPISHKTELIEGTVSYSEAFDPDDPTLMDCYPRCEMENPFVTDHRLRYNNERFAIN